MRIGRMRKRVAVENPGRTKDGAGGWVDGYTAATPSPVWASVEPATEANVERLAGAKVEAKYSHVVEIRYHASVTTKSRIVLGARALLVRAVVNPGERNERLLLGCEEVA